MNCSVMLCYVTSISLLFFDFNQFFKGMEHIPKLSICKYARMYRVKKNS